MSVLDKKWLTLPELAEYLSCSESIFYHRLSPGSVSVSEVYIEFGKA